MSILNSGSLNLDYIYKVSHFVQPGETLAATEQKTVPGGKGLNQSIALARAGANLFHAGCIGAGGTPLFNLLQSENIALDYLYKTEVPQGNAIIQVNPLGENCILLFGGSNQALTLKQVENTFLNFKPGDYLLLQNEINLLDDIIRIATAKKLQIILNPSPFDEKLQKLDYSQISWLIVNEIEAQQLTGLTEPEKIWNHIHDFYPSLKLILTLGSNGSYVFTPTETIFQPAFTVTAVDTTAAGDTFTGYFVYGLSMNKPLADCIEQATAAAACCVSKEGASSSIPYMPEVTSFLNSRTN